MGRKKETRFCSYVTKCDRCAVALPEGIYLENVQLGDDDDNDNDDDGDNLDENPVDNNATRACWLLLAHTGHAG